MCSSKSTCVFTLYNKIIYLLKLTCPVLRRTITVLCEDLLAYKIIRVRTMITEGILSFRVAKEHCSIYIVRKLTSKSILWLFLLIFKALTIFLNYNLVLIDCARPSCYFNSTTFDFDNKWYITSLIN